MKGRFCAICGTTVGPFVENLCEKCYLKEYPIDFGTIDKIELELCPSCESISVGGLTVNHLFVDQNLETVIRELAKSKIIEKFNLTVPYRYEFLEEDIEEERIREGYKEFKITTRLHVRPHPEFNEISVETTTTIELHKVTCQQCIKFKTGYHEAILQVRGTNRKLTEEEEEKIEQIIREEVGKHGDPKTSYLFEYVTNEEGITTKVSTKFLAEELAKKIKSVMAAKYTVAYKLVTQTRDGRDVYRNTYLVRLPEYIRKDIVEFQDQVWYIIGVKENEVVLLSLENHEQRKVNRKKFENSAKKRTEEIFKREYMYISDEGETAMIMTMDTFENYEEKKAKIPKNAEVGETIKGFILDEKDYYFP
ncbi:MAG: NMD3-related protein, partial [Candidatus Heimdallarchaeaceae archaeon]